MSRVEIKIEMEDEIWGMEILWKLSHRNII